MTFEVSLNRKLAFRGVALISHAPPASSRVYSFLPLLWPGEEIVKLEPDEELCLLHRAETGLQMCRQWHQLNILKLLLPTALPAIFCPSGSPTVVSIANT
jgi:hypothetical protein